MIEKFDCNILRASYMQTSGSSLKKMIQNNSTPILDLYVRESIQNSLDASKANVDCINVDIMAREFDAYKFSNYFDGIGDELKKQLSEGKIINTFLAIKDTNTIGLVGREDGSAKSGEKGQNLGNLVFNIMHAQTEEGSGGCWGIGKTIFYRMSKTGLVLFYSRIELEDHTFQERMVGALIEDEQNINDCLLKNDNYRGISFYGMNIRNADGSQLTKVITESSFIKQVLDCFEIKQLDGNDTGTIVIVPFTDFNSLCQDHPSYDELWNDVSWSSNITKYLDISIKRWYFPRLSNIFDMGPKLNANINGKPVAISDLEEPLFYIYEEIFNAIVKYKKNPVEMTYKVGNIMVEKVKRKTSISSELGWLGFIEVSANRMRELGFGAGFLNYNPYIYAGLQEEDYVGDRNLPIVAYMRKPGMIISYNTKGDWAGNGSISTSKGSYLIALFVLNSTAIIEKANISLEEYARGGEKADHCSWLDHSLKGTLIKGNKRFIKSICQGISQILNSIYNPITNDTNNLSDNVAWQNALSSWLPDGLGKRSSSIVRTTETTTSISNSKKILIAAKNDTKFIKDGIEKSFDIKSKGSFLKQQIILSIHTVDSNISLKDREEKAAMPPVCTITGGVIVFDEFGKNRTLIDEPTALTLDGGSIGDEFAYEFLKTQKGIVYGISLTYKGEDLSARLKLIIRIFDRNYQIAYGCKG